MISIVVNAQIGIGTTTPDASSILDISSTSQGMLAPRMTTVQRTAIVAPADGLIVYDIVLKSFYYYVEAPTSSWVPVNSSVNGRTNFKRIKSVADLAPELTAGGASKYLLDASTLYEINGTINLNFPIDLNNAYIQGLDSGEDKLISAGDIFQGSKGGGIKSLTLSSTGGKVFNLSGATSQNLIFRDCIVSSSKSVGSINNFGLVFLSIIQFSGNTTGIEYSNISQLLLSNLGWFGNNAGTFEKLTGTFGLVQKQGGFSQVNGTAVGFDVSSNPIISGDAVLESVVFTGSIGAVFVKPYSLNTYTGYNFTNAWTVDSPGIPRESDGVATGDINFSTGVGNVATTTFTSTGPTGRKKIFGPTSSNNLFRFKQDGDNKIIYTGTKTRYFQVAGSVSYQGTGDFTLILYIARNGAVITETKVYGKGATGYFTNAGILALPIIGTVELKKSDYIEIWAERYAGSGNMETVSLNLIAR
ncbi:hypothetical protein ACRASX_09705 [Flavobacterium sp. TMP13]|uniref:hypothetical protein n=1 Tax=Flavobacterium sp. TMP13 TaxID=3425950 RepID=UPI003D76F4B4